ncbi:hypothetical protein FOZ62_019385, partial [Perkinsus olseni]
MSNTSLYSDTIPRRKGGVELANSSTGYDWAFNNLNAIGSDLSRMRPRIPSAACYILGGFLNYEIRYHIFSFNTWQYSPESVARNVETDDIKAWTDASLGSEFYAESSSILRILEVAYNLDVPLATFVFFYTMEKRCDSKVKQQRARDVLRTYFASSEKECLTFLRTLESGEGYSLVNSQIVPSDIELENGPGAIRLNFCVREPPAEQVTPTTPTPAASTAESPSKGEEISAEVVDPKDGDKDGAVLDSSKKEKVDEEDVVHGHDDKEEITINEWGVLLRVGILYVGVNPSEGNNIKKVKTDWLAVKQGKSETFEGYVANERQRFEKLSLTCDWAGIDAPSEYDRIVHFISNVSPTLSSAYTKSLRRKNKRPEDLTYRDVISDITNINIGMSIDFPWDRSSASTSNQSGTSNNQESKKEHQTSATTTSNNGKGAKSTKSDPASIGGSHHQKERQKQWCKYCEREVFHKPEHCWKRGQGTDTDKASPASSKSHSEKTPASGPSVTARVIASSSKGEDSSKATTGKQYSLRPTPQRQPGFSYSSSPSTQKPK